MSKFGAYFGDIIEFLEKNESSGGEGWRGGGGGERDCCDSKNHKAGPLCLLK